jgi:hypothetical protein
VSTVVIVWLIIALVTTAMVIAVLVGLVRHLFVLGRAVGRFSDEVAPLAQSISTEAARASGRTQGWSAGRRPGAR